MLLCTLPLPPPAAPVSCGKELSSHLCYEHPRKYLRAYGMECHVPHKEITLFLSVTVFFSLCLYVLRTDLEALGFVLTDAIVAIWVLGALLLGYQQWRETRHEISTEKYYDRLEIANKKREHGGVVVYSMMHPGEHFTEDLLKKNVLVYSELDNLEYTIEKYKLGFMKPEQACRGLRTFQHRCRSKEFREMAQMRVVQGDYDLDTYRVVLTVIEQIQRTDPGALGSSHNESALRRWLSLLDMVRGQKGRSVPFAERSESPAQGSSPASSPARPDSGADSPT